MVLLTLLGFTSSICPVVTRADRERIKDTQAVNQRGGVQVASPITPIGGVHVAPPITPIDV